MNVQATIQRELRAQARLPFTYGVRVIGASALLATCSFFALTYGFRPNAGGALFGNLNTVLFLAIWALVPLLAADCISRERRDGTLGLLFLTPLKAPDIVLAKGFVHGLRALSLWLAVLPMLMLPFWQGGVGWREAVLSALINFSAVCLALAAGIAASTLCKKWLAANILAFFLGTIFAVGFMVVTGSVVADAVTSGRTASGRWGSAYFGGYGYGFQYGLEYVVFMQYTGDSPFDFAVQRGFLAATGVGGGWGSTLAGIGKANQAAWLQAQAWLALVSFLALLLVIRLAAWRLRAIWQEEPPSARRLWLEEKLYTPVVAVSLLRRWMRRKLERNPIGWLEQRSWSGRLVMWGWLAVMISLYSAALGGTVAYRAIYNLQQLMAWLLLVGVASSAAGSFQRERETGVMELLLVSPMTVRQIIGGRLRGLWGQFLPALLLLLAVWAYFRGLFLRQNDYEWMQFFAGGFLTLPVIGLYYSLRRRSFITAFLSTLFTGLFLPFLIEFACQWVLKLVFGVDSGRLSGYAVIAVVNGGNLPQAQWLLALQRLADSVSLVTILQLVMAVRFSRRLYRDMERRNFSFSRAIT